MNPLKYFITDSADIIKKRARFLEMRGFKLIEENEFILEYSVENIIISILFDRYADSSDIKIRFIGENKSFSIGWMLKVNEEVQYNDYMINKVDKLINVLGLLNFLEDYYDQIIDINFCENMLIKTRDYLEKQN